jgi:predicted lipoprotein with Yx(FWY)xxD motif
MHAQATVGAKQISLGTVLVDANGMTLYALTKDSGGMPTCTGGCASAWPPAKANGTPTVGPGVTATLTVVMGPNGDQLKAGTWPLYRFAGDSKPGEANGQGTGGVWYVVGADGTLIK